MDPTVLTEMVDRIVADRYRLDDLVGSGTLSAVFAAWDLLDERRVAVKLFDPAVTSDEVFVARLLEAIEQAAQLEHANIARIHDWGVDGEPFIVSELCEGGSLAALLEAGHRLTASQALVLTLEAARALHHAHQRGMAHRDLTPRNLLFSEDQRLRLTDFALARVMADAPAARGDRGIDNVRYASPEQARGRPVGEASDLYSLALVISEAVSGDAPTVADTVIGTLMARAESPAELSSSLDALLPPLERCGRVDPEERPEADELTIALLAAAETMPRPAGLPLVGLLHRDTSAPPAGDAETVAEVDVPTDQADADDAFDVGVSGALDDTDDFADGDPVGEDDVDFDIPDTAAVLTEPHPTEPDPARPDPIEDRPRLGGLENLAEAEPVFAAPADSDDSDDAGRLDVPERRATARSARLAYQELDDDADDRLPWWPLLVLGLLVAGVIALVVLFATGAGPITASTVPDLIGTEYDEAIELVDDRGWQVERLEDRIDGSVAGSILAQSPAGGSELDEGETLTLTVSLGNEMVEIPSDIVGLTVDQAASRLGSVGLVVGELTEENNESLEAGLVVALDEPTTQKPTGEGVSLRISLGPQDRVVPPGIIGMTIADATGLLTGLRLQAVEEPVFDPEAPPGTVLDSLPQPGEALPADSQVTLLVSAGPEPVIMPDIVGLPLNEAIDVIEELGLIFVDTEGTPGEDAIGSLPPIGATVDVGTEVTIILDDPPDDEEADATDE